MKAHLKAKYLLLTHIVGLLKRLPVYFKQEVPTMNIKATKKRNQVITANVFGQLGTLAKVESIKNSLKALTCYELEAKVKFN